MRPATYINESCNIYKCGTPYICMRHFTHMNAAGHKYEYDLTHNKRAPTQKTSYKVLVSIDCLILRATIHGRYHSIPHM